MQQVQQFAGGGEIQPLREYLVQGSRQHPGAAGGHRPARAELDGGGGIHRRGRPALDIGGDRGGTGGGLVRAQPAVVAVGHPLHHRRGAGVLEIDHGARLLPGGIDVALVNEMGAAGFAGGMAFTAAIRPHQGIVESHLEILYLLAGGGRAGVYEFRRAALATQVHLALAATAAGTPAAGLQNGQQGQHQQWAASRYACKCGSQDVTPTNGRRSTPPLQRTPASCCGRHGKCSQNCPPPWTHPAWTEAPAGTPPGRTSSPGSRQRPRCWPAPCPGRPHHRPRNTPG